jgi:hypothetical protein
MEKTSTVQEVGTINRWDGPKGTVFYHNILLENGDRGSIGKKAEGAIKIGDKLTYTIEFDDRGNKIKEVREPFNGGAAKGFRGSNASFALAYAKDICVANIAKAETPIPMDHALAQRVLTIASEFKQWLGENE